MGSVYAYRQGEARFFALFAVAKAPFIWQKQEELRTQSFLSGYFGRLSPEPLAFPKNHAQYRHAETRMVIESAP